MDLYSTSWISIWCWIFILVQRYRIAKWAVQKFDAALEYLAIRWGWTWLQNDPNAWRVKYPKITSKIDELEGRLKKLEGKNAKKKT